MQAIDDIGVVMPSQQDAHLAMETVRKLAARSQGDKHVEVRLLNDGEQPAETVQLPASAVRLLINILDQMAQGNAVTLMPIHAELTTVQAAEVLNVSRPHLIKLLEEGKISYHRVGTHRRIRAEDALAFKREKMVNRQQTLDQLAALDQQLGI
jgi:excisionase family DNA binding protein